MGLCPECLLKAGSATATGATPLETGKGRFVPPTPEALARYFPQLEILELLGHGGMGAVYKARQKELDRIVALKILPPGISHDRSFSQRFTREAQALAKLNHPHIVTLYDFGQADGLFYFFMEYVDGMNLRQLLDGRHLSPDEALAIVPQICDALQYAHDRGIVHRDIKPENLLLGRDGQVKIADFGVARIVAGEETGGQLLKHDITFQEWTSSIPSVLGTPQYMAPEQRLRPGEVDHRADIYSLGVVFYQLLTGELPGRPIEMPSRKVEVDVRLDRVVLRALEQEPERRYHQASGMKAEVETIAATRARVSGTTGMRLPLFAGFWRRTAALLMDYALVSAVAFPFVLLIAVAAPGSIVVETPLGLGTTERILEDHSSDTGGHRVVETTVLGRWSYLYHQSTDAKGRKETSRLIDPDSRRPLKTTSAGTLYLGLLLLYWIVMESSRWQASVGKAILRIHVTDWKGERLSFDRALGRNLSKIFSFLTLGFGFMMAGVDGRKQALHDKIANSFVRCGGPGARKGEPRPLTFRGKLWRVALFGTLFYVLVVFPLRTKAYHDRTAQGQAEPVAAEAGTPVASLRFGPVIERTLGDMTAKSDIPELLDFKTGALFFQSEVLGEHPPSEPEEYGRRHRQYGTDAGGTLLAGDRGVIGWELATVPESPDAWERLTAEAVHRALAEIPLRNPVIFHGTGTLPATYLFKTRTGEEGVLQITGFGEKPPGVMIRYKLLEGLAPATPPAREDLLTMDHPTVQLKAWPGEVYSVDGEEYDLDGLYGKLNKLAFQQAVDRKVIPMTVSAAKGVDPAQIRFLTETARAFGINSREVLAGNPAAVPPSGIRQPRFQIRAGAGDKEEADTFTDSNGSDTIRLAKKVWLDEGDVRSARVEIQNGNRLIGLKLTINGTRKFAALTHAFLHKRVALLFDGKVLAAPVLQVPIYGGVLYHQSLNLSEAEEAVLLEVLNRGEAGHGDQPEEPR
ncbi:MAG TPA: protein kinase [Chthoniobacteraceae bacterium]|nr:protein kinase [Chthoniobacteraceae bacterium]